MVNKLSPLDYGMDDYIKFYFCLSLANGNLYNSLISLYGKKLDFEKEICITDSESLYIKQGFNQIKKIYDYVDIENIDYLKIFDQKVLDIEFINFRKDNEKPDLSEFLKYELLKRARYIKQTKYGNLKNYFKYFKMNDILKAKESLDFKYKRMFNEKFFNDGTKSFLYNNLSTDEQKLIVGIYKGLIKINNMKKTEEIIKDVVKEEKENSKVVDTVKENNLDDIKGEDGMARKRNDKDSLMKSLDLKSEKELGELVDKLPSKNKEIMRYMYGILTDAKSMEWILNELGISKVTVYRKISESKEMLKDIKEGKEVTNENKEPEKVPEKSKVNNAQTVKEENKVKKVRGAAKKTPETVSDLAKRYDVSQEFVYNVISNLSSGKKAKVAKLYFIDGMPQASIKESTNISPSYISVVIKQVHESIKKEKEKMENNNSNDEKEIIKKEETKKEENNKPKTLNEDKKADKKMDNINDKLLSYIALSINDVLYDDNELKKLKEDKFMLFTMLSLIKKHNFTSSELQDTLLLSDKEMKLLYEEAADLGIKKINKYMEDNKKEITKRLIDNKRN